MKSICFEGRVALQNIRTSRSWGPIVTFFAVAALLAGCGQSEKYPEAYGLYAWDGKAWLAIGKAQKTIELDFPADAKFLVHEKDVGRVSKSFAIYQQVFVRSIISQNPEGGNRVVKPHNAWDVNEALVVEGRFSPVKDKPEMVVWAPAKKLVAGVYQPRIEGTPQDSFFVSKAEILGSKVSANPHCVDLVKTTAWGIPMGIPDEFKACAATDKAAMVPKALSEVSALVRQSGTRLPESGRAALTILAEGASNPNLRISGANSLLSIAAQSGFEDVIQALLARGADINAKEDDGSPLYWAIDAGQHSAVLLLISRGADVNHTKSGGFKPMDLVSQMDESNPRTKEVIAALKAKGAVASR